VKNGGVDGTGKIARIPFCLLAGRAGLPRSDHAKEQAARIHVRIAHFWKEID
jgi:hypothetical protein